MASESPNRRPSTGVAPARAPSDPWETIDAQLDPSAEAELTACYQDLLSAPEGPGELGWLAHYRVLTILGRGGMGMVFRAEDTQLQRPVALKVILPEFAGSLAARERFLREARAGAVIKNDHVATVYQVGQDRDVPFLAMELLEGESLDQRLRRGGPPTLPEVLRIGREMATGLAAAHAHGLIHRDVKPANVWLEAPDGRVKLLDFGLARAAGASSNLTQTGKIVGTPEFMAPEQARGEEVDVRSDLFSLGAVLYTLCAGQRPFQGSSIMSVLTALAVETPRPVRTLNPAVPVPLAAFIDRLLEKAPAKRPASAEEVIATLAAIENAGASIGWESPPPLPTSPAPLRRRPRWVLTAGAAGVAALLGIVALVASLLSSDAEGNPGDRPAAAAPSGPPLRIGVLHSRTGTMAISERPVIDAVLLAVDELNDQGGVLGRPVEAVVADGQSDEAVFAAQAEKLIRDDHVAALFGCWTSASRKAVLPVVERHDHLLFYPVQYEGVEQSPNVVYLGPTPNQQILPALRWLVGFEGKRRWFLVGSDYVFPRTAHAIIRDEAKARGCEVVGEAYLPLGATDVANLVKQIAAEKPDLIVNTINGDTNVAFFRALRRAGITPAGTPTLSFSLSEEELEALGPRDTTGDYVAANYFQSLDTPRNREFMERFRSRYGTERTVSSPMQSAYLGVHLWARAVRTAGRDDLRAVRAAVMGRPYDAPQGLVQIDPATQHAVQVARVGRMDDAGEIAEVYASPQPIMPEPFPASRSREQWVGYLEGLRERWGGRWSSPGS